MIYTCIYLYLKHENIVCNSTVLIAYSSLGHAVELVGTCTEDVLGCITGLFL